MKHDWNETGYDLIRTDRWLYVFGVPDDAVVKVGLVLLEERLEPRLREVAKKSGKPDLRLLGASAMVNVNHEEAEHIESAVRLWLTRCRGCEFVGVVDWIRGPSTTCDWQAMLDDAVSAIMRIGAES